MLYSVESKKDIEETVRALEKAVRKRKIGLFKVHNLKEEMAKKGIDLKKECRIYQFTKCEELKLPLTISVFTEAGRVRIATLKGAEVLKFAPDMENTDVVDSLQRQILEVMEEASK